MFKKVVFVLFFLFLNVAPLTAYGQIKLHFDADKEEFSADGCADTACIEQSIQAMINSTDKENLDALLKAETYANTLVAESGAIANDAHPTELARMKKVLTALRVKPENAHPNIFEDPDDEIGLPAFSLSLGDKLEIYADVDLFEFIDDDQLMAIIAHELGHDRYDTIRQIFIKGVAKTNEMLALQLQMNIEFKADQVGSLILEKAGKPKDGILKFLQYTKQLYAKSKPDFIEEQVDPRIESLQKFLQK